MTKSNQPQSSSQTSPQSGQRLGQQQDQSLNKIVRSEFGKGSSASAIGCSQGSADKNYNLISVLYHSLKGCETYQKFQQDAQAAGDQQLVQLLRTTCEDLKGRADQAKELLLTRLDRGQIDERGTGSGQNQTRRPQSAIDDDEDDIAVQG